jgi:hypothetical protein
MVRYINTKEGHHSALILLSMSLSRINVTIIYIMYADAAQNCPLFEGPLNKTVFKAEVQEVLRAVKQRVKSRKNKANNEKKNSEEENDGGETRAPNNQN